jgi:hypothetical protein
VGYDFDDCGFFGIIKLEVITGNNNLFLTRRSETFSQVAYHQALK